MAQAKWVLRVKEALTQNPLYILQDGTPVCARCGGEGVKGRVKAALYRVTNYGRQWDHCERCGFKYT